MEGHDALLLQLEESAEWIDHLERSNAESKKAIAHLKHVERLLREEYQSWAARELESVQELTSSRAWKLAKWLHDAARYVAPPSSRRRRLLRLGFRVTKAVPKLRRREFLARQAQRFYRRARGITGMPQAQEDDLALPHFPRVERVDVSIVIPVYNHLRDTIACLESIKASAPDLAYEIIVVDDGSSEETARCLREVEGVIYVRNEQNQGFVGTCNRGASVARGAYLVFLNNDTTVTGGWLDALCATFETFPNAGLVGAKLIYPNGRLQEAGGVIWRDASGWNFGNGEDPDHPRFNFVREVDYCSGACIMVPRDLFHSLGGFDRRYSPAYYEDADLAFKIREAGYKVLYQPKARVIHHEGLTSGTNLNSGPKAYQLINQPKFQARWAERLASHPERPDQLLRYVSAHGDRATPSGQVLVVDHRVPMPDRDAGSFRMMEILRAIRRRNLRVTFVPDDLMATPGYVDELLGMGIEVVHWPHYASIVDCLEEPGRDFRLAILSRCDVAARSMTPIRRLAPAAKIVFDTVDLHFKREERQAELLRDDALREASSSRKRKELRLAARADLTLVVSPLEKAILEAEVPGLNVRVLPTIYDVAAREPISFENRRDIVFIGGFEHPPNVDAVLYFVGDILPRVRDRLPGAVFHVIGPDVPPEIRALASPWVRIHGHVADVRPIFDRSRVSVAPLRFGAGVKGKVNQSMALGVPAIVTSIAAEGMHLFHEQNAMIADDAGSFADALVRAWSSPELWRRLSTNGQANIRDYFSVEAATRTVDAMLEWAGLGKSSESGRAASRQSA